MSELYDLYKKVGNEGFGKMVGEIAPYFSTIHPEFNDLRPGYCEIKVTNVRDIHNHLGTVHAIAMCNGAELVAGLMTDVSIPDTKRWIPVGMNVKYLAMAKDDLKVITDGSNIDWETDGNLVVNVTVYSGEIAVLEAEITMMISNKK